MAQWLHYAYQNHNIPPGILMGIRTVNEPIPEGERVFMMASDKEALEEGYTPLKVIHFAGKGGASWLSGS